MALFPPLVNSSLPAFSADSNEIKFYFSFPNTMNKTEINRSYIQYSIVNQINNVSVLAQSADMQEGVKTVYQDEIFEIIDTNKRYFYIRKNDIIDGWKPGTIYKVQLRFKDSYGHSEWSTVCYLKATGNKRDITLQIINATEESFTVYTDSPQFYGKYAPAQSDPSEIQKKYRFVLREYNTGNLIEDSGWKAHEENIVDNIVFSKLLDNYKKYLLQYSIETKNKYIQTVEADFICAIDLISSPNIEFSKLENNQEEGYIKIQLTSNNMLSTNLILRRTDSKSNFSFWEDYQIFNIWDEQANIEFKDYLVEHGIEYKYSIQSLSKTGQRGKAIQSNIIRANYEHMFLVGNNRQLKIKFNPEVSNFKRVLQENKIETIGSQFPFIVRNGNINYFTFPIKGLLSYHSDEEELFCSKNSLCVGNQTTADNAYQVNLTDDNIVFEREFRNQVEKFLTSGDYKYFKSPTEGVKLIALTGVSLSPEDVLGRMIYSFSATAYEMGDTSLNYLLNLNIVNSGEYIDSKDIGEKSFFKILHNFRVPSLNYDLFNNDIKQDIEGKVNGVNYARKLKYLKNVTIEVLNDIDCKIKIQQQKNGAWTEILISKTIGIYSIPDIVNIYGLQINSINALLNITYEAVCYYEESSSSSNITPNVFEIISNFSQIYDIFNISSGNMNLFTAFKNINPELVTIYNFSYFKIEAAPGTQFKINGEVITLEDSGFKEFKNMLITDASMITETTASISVVYNGAK